MQWTSLTSGQQSWTADFVCEIVCHHGPWNDLRCGLLHPSCHQIHWCQLEKTGSALRLLPRQAVQVHEHRQQGLLPGLPGPQVSRRRRKEKVNNDSAKNLQVITSQDRRSATSLKQNSVTGFSFAYCGKRLYWVLNHDTFFILKSDKFTSELWVIISIIQNSCNSCLIFLAW